MSNLAERIFGGAELIFWRLAVRLLSLTQPISRRAFAHGSNMRVPTRASIPFARSLLSALLGWVIGLLLGYFLTSWVM